MLLPVAIALVGCADDSTVADEPVTTEPDVTLPTGPGRNPTPGPQPNPSPDPTPARDGEAGSGLPRELVGTWIAADSHAAELVYAFEPDRTYRHASVLLQQREAGTFSFTINARGTVTIDGENLILRPKSGTQRLQEPERPGGGSKRPVDMSPRRYAWAVETSGSSPRLRITDPSGSSVDYRKR
jgi:hypothetical protein